jgi:hypothetical protein
MFIKVFAKLCQLVQWCDPLDPYFMPQKVMDFCLPWWLKEGQDPLQRNAQLTALASARRWPSALRLVQKAWVQRWQTDDYGCSQVVDAISQSLEGIHAEISEKNTDVAFVFSFKRK